MFADLMMALVFIGGLLLVFVGAAISKYARGISEFIAGAIVTAVGVLLMWASI